ncbi:hypothetical protein B0H13DRAFT_1897436 [Mycena leptocephala]|nr:hypothetical protein B0H13DRAFT_1897436 [Mycena leptocephala]
MRLGPPVADGSTGRRYGYGPVRTGLAELLVRITGRYTAPHHPALGKFHLEECLLCPLDMILLIAHYFAFYVIFDLSRRWRCDGAEFRADTYERRAAHRPTSKMFLCLNVPEIPSHCPIDLTEITLGMNVYQKNVLGASAWAPNYLKSTASPSRGRGRRETR